MGWDGELEVSEEAADAAVGVVERLREMEMPQVDLEAVDLYLKHIDEVLGRIQDPPEEFFEVTSMEKHLELEQAYSGYVQRG